MKYDLKLSILINIKFRIIKYDIQHMVEKKNRRVKKTGECHGNTGEIEAGGG